jgi:glyoxylase-like metal-dependent hydrolase (beta-lactamase superfamily II)/ADP-ribose pyrophosphatase YjhB (NUDIX family)
MAFQSGFYAFPGGQLDADEDVRVCAVRELAEEVGVQVDPEALVEAGRWVTPFYAPRRFDTVFFLAKCPENQTARLISEEHDLAEWIRPADALSRWMEGRILMAAPIHHTLRCLTEGLENIEARIRTIPEARGEPPVAVELRPGIVLVPLLTPTLPPATHTNCYVIGCDEVIVIDPASSYTDQQQILDGVLKDRRIREIWLTHLHRDHVGGAEHLRTLRHVPVAAHAVTARDLAGVVSVDRILEDGEKHELAGNPGWLLRVIHTPGHARGHVCIFEEKNGSLITGDLMAGFGTIVIDPPEGHMATYIDSLKRIRDLDATALFPSHGPVMANAKAKIQEYLHHRLLRENNILKAWQSGLRDKADIVRAVYTDVDSAMYALAERSVAAHLEKLSEEKKL